MGQQPSNDDLMKKTLITVGAMLGASVVFVGALSLIASAIAGKAVGAPTSEAATEATGTAARSDPAKPAMRRPAHSGPRPNDSL